MKSNKKGGLQLTSRAWEKYRFQEMPKNDKIGRTLERCLGGKRDSTAKRVSLRACVRGQACSC